MLLKRQRWQDDKTILTRSLHYFQASQLRVSIFLFPEGAIFRKKTKKLSNIFAQNHKLTEYQYVLHPKTKGFAHIAAYQLRANLLDAVYDVNLAYLDYSQNVWNVNITICEDIALG